MRHPPGRPSAARLLLQLLAALLLPLLAAWLAGAPSAAAQPHAVPAEPAVLDLQHSPDGVDPWAFLQVWSDPGRGAGIEAVLQQRHAFRAPEVPRNSFGPREDALWLRLPLQVPAGDRSSWVLSIDYTDLASIDYYLVSGDQVVDRQALGERVVFSARALAVSTHAVRLAVQPGRRYEVFLRVQNVGEVIVPIRLLTEPQLQARETELQFSMGLLLGVTLALLAYCLLYGAYLREPLFLLYAAQLVSLGGYLCATRGVLCQYLWPDDPWWSVHDAGFLLALALAAACAFIDRVLNVAALRRWCSWVLRAVAGVGVAMAVLLWLGGIDLATMNDVFSVLGATPVVLGAWCAWLRWRLGDRVAGWIFIERVAQSAGVLTLAGIVQGLLPATAFTMDLFLWTSMLEMGIWIWALGTRARMLLDAEQHARADQARLQTIAHIDMLTGLLNRHGMQEALSHVLVSAGPSRMVAVYVLDLDGFKAVNDTHGHAAGDALLAAVALRLRGCLRRGDIVARLGGDEFVVAAVDLPQAAAAGRIGQLLQQQFEQPFHCGPVACRLGVTIGYALAPEDGTDVEGLLRSADQAMYAGKREAGVRAAGGEGDVGGAGAPPLPPAQRLRRGAAAAPPSAPPVPAPQEP
jgi:diguanylate cyclase (GGDEF)-like protein